MLLRVKMSPDSSRMALEYVKKAAALLRRSDTIIGFKENFNEIYSIVSKIPDHKDLVEVNVDSLEDWQVTELRTSLIENLKKTQDLTQKLLKTID